MTGRNANIYFPEETYNKLREVAGQKISRFVSEAVEEKNIKRATTKKGRISKKVNWWLSKNSQ